MTVPEREGNPVQQQDQVTTYTAQKYNKRQSGAHDAHHTVSVLPSHGVMQAAITKQPRLQTWPLQHMGVECHMSHSWMYVKMHDLCT